MLQLTRFFKNKKDSQKRNDDERYAVARNEQRNRHFGQVHIHNMLIWPVIELVPLMYQFYV